jgi:hypothetical protein
MLVVSSVNRFELARCVVGTMPTTSTRSYGKIVDVDTFKQMSTGDRIRIAKSIWKGDGDDSGGFDVLWSEYQEVLDLIERCAALRMVNMEPVVFLFHRRGVELLKQLEQLKYEE